MGKGTLRQRWLRGKMSLVKAVDHGILLPVKMRTTSHWNNLPGKWWMPQHWTRLRFSWHSSGPSCLVCAFDKKGWTRRSSKSLQTCSSMILRFYDNVLFFPSYKVFLFIQEALVSQPFGHSGLRMTMLGCCGASKDNTALAGGMKRTLGLPKLPELCYHKQGACKSPGGISVSETMALSIFLIKKHVLKGNNTKIEIYKVKS